MRTGLSQKVTDVCNFFHQTVAKPDLTPEVYHMKKREMSKELLEVIALGEYYGLDTSGITEEKAQEIVRMADEMKELIYGNSPLVVA